jgi:hypothetical protein
MLHNSVTARWVGALSGNRPDEKRHWRTKTSYYRALAGLLADGEAAPPWYRIVHAVEPKGSRSTFYEVAGSRARNPLIGALVADGSAAAIQVALCYERSGAVDRLIDETKVWDYWPHREGLLVRHRGLDEPTTARALVSSVAEWAHRRPVLAAALDHAPPVCAVEDLLLLHKGRLSAFGAAAALRQTIRDAAAGPLPVAA